MTDTRAPHPDPVPASSREAADLNVPSKVRAEYPNKAPEQAAEPLGTRHPSTAIPAERGEARPPDQLVGEIQVQSGALDAVLSVYERHGTDRFMANVANLRYIHSLLSRAVAALAAPAAQPETAPHERVRKLARGFAQEWLRPVAPEQADETLVRTLQTAMVAFYACAHALDERRAAPAAGEAPPDKQLNGWRELGQEMERILTFMTKRQREDLCPDWFIPRLLEMLATSPGRRAPAQEPK